MSRDLHGGGPVRRITVLLGVSVAAVAAASAFGVPGSDATSSQIYPAVRSWHATAASPAAGGADARADCSRATARQLVEQHRLNPFLLPNPVGQVLCGPFTGPASEAMAVTTGAPTCWPIQGWAVFRFTEGDWRLVLAERYAFIVPPLVAVGSDIRETAPVFRRGDSRCVPSGGTHARIWHWNGTRLIAGPWKQVTNGEPEAKGFYSPSRNISCGMSDNSAFRGVECQSHVPSQKVSMDAAGRVTICRGSYARCKLGNAGEAPTLGYGKQITAAASVESNRDSRTGPRRVCELRLRALWKGS